MARVTRNARVMAVCSAGLVLAGLSVPHPENSRVRLLPHFTPGDAFRYRVETHSKTTGKATTPVANPEGASALEISASLTVRLDVLESQTPSGDASPRLRMRATYEQAAATTQSDAYDPAAAELADQYNRLEGHSVEFTVEPDGRTTNVTGLEDLVTNPSAAGNIRSWIEGLSPGAGFPHGGIAVGQKWTNERPLPDVPLAGLVSRIDSSYLRNEPCPAGARTGASGVDSAALRDTCAVILTRFEILRRGAKADSTREDYLRNGLRTSGTWTGGGESLDSISLQTGILQSSTQTSLQDMDFSVTSASTGSTMRYAGHVDSQTQVTLVLATSAKP